MQSRPLSQAPTRVLPPALHLICCVLLALILTAALPIAAWADTAAGPSGEKAAQVDGAEWTVEARVKRLMNSHTSYEFGNPVPPTYAPLSRLEFDLDSWWGGVAVGRRTALWSVSLEVLRSLSGELDGQLKDSDWEDGAEPWKRTTYSESELRMRDSYMINASADISVASWLGLPQGWRLGPVGGVRWQRFKFTAHDGTQWEDYDDGTVDTVPLPGDVIDFRQDFWHYFIGLKLEWQPQPLKRPGLRVTAQADWAYVKGDNQDHHLLRGGYRITEESTSGHAWHLLLGLEAPLWKSWFLGLQAEYLDIDTSGSHRLYHDIYGMDETWDNGVNVWSRQVSLLASLGYRF